MKLKSVMIPAMAVGMVLTSCGSEADVPRDPTADYKMLTDNPKTQYIHETEFATLIPETNSDVADELQDHFKESNFTPGWRERGVEAVGTRAQRFVVKVRLGGDYARLKNDGVCENIEVAKTEWPGKPYIAALAIGSSKDQVATIAWPSGSNEITVCVNKGKHPSAGVIVMAPHVSR